MVKYIRKNRITIVHSHGKGGGVYSRLLKLLIPGIKIIHTFHGVHISEHSFLMKILYIILERIFKFVTSGFINVSNGERDMCIKLGIINTARAFVIYNSVAKRKIIDKKSIRKKLKLPINKIIIITVSRFDHLKNMGMAFKIAEKFITNKNVIFLWLGDGEEKISLEQRALDNSVNNIIFKGFKNNVSEYLNASNVYLSTSQREGLPISLIEAMAYKLPIVASDVIGNNEVVNSDAGYLFNINDYDDAVKKIDKLIKNNKLINKLGKQGYYLFLSKFNVNKMIKTTSELYFRISNGCD